MCQILHYNKYLYSEQITESENENDHFDLDHFDRPFPRYILLQCLIEEGIRVVESKIKLMELKSRELLGGIENNTYFCGVITINSKVLCLRFWKDAYED